MGRFGDVFAQCGRADVEVVGSIVVYISFSRVGIRKEKPVKWNDSVNQ